MFFFCWGGRRREEGVRDGALGGGGRFYVNFEVWWPAGNNENN